MWSSHPSSSTANALWKRVGTSSIQDMWWDSSSWNQESISLYHPLSILTSVPNSGCASTQRVNPTRETRNLRRHMYEVNINDLSVGFQFNEKTLLKYWQFHIYIVLYTFPWGFFFFFGGFTSINVSLVLYLFCLFYEKSAFVSCKINVFLVTFIVV